MTTLDPAKGGSFQDAQAAWALYDPLVTFNQQGQVIPDVATSWTATPSSDTFHIRAGVICSDGSKLTAAATAASLRRYLDPSTGAPLLAEAIGANNTATVTSSGDTVTVSLVHPWSQLLIGLTLPFTGIVCPAGLKDPASLVTHSDGTGAYVASSEVSGASYTFVRRADYSWGPKYLDQPKGALPKNLVLKVVTDENTMANLMATGSLDIAPYGTTDWTRFKGKTGYTFVTQAQSDTILVFNETPGLPTAKQSVRLAITEALNRVGITSVLGNGHGYLESNLGEPTYICYDPALSSLVPAYKPSTASSVLHGLNLSIMGTTALAGGNGTSYLLAALNQAGAHATLKNLNDEAWATELFNGKNNWDMTILLYGDILNSLVSAAGFFTGAAPPKGENIGDVQNPPAASAYAEAGTLTGSASCAATNALQRALIVRNDLVPLAAIPVTDVFSAGYAASVVKGFVVPSTIRING